MIDSDANKGLACVECGSVRLATLDTRARGRMTRRRKSCRGCGKSFYTLEIAEEQIPDSPELDQLFERSADGQA